MLANLESACLVDQVFYDAVSRWDDDSTNFAPAVAPVPVGWQRRDRDVWVHLSPDGSPLPPQGWKVHVSACLNNADRVVEIVYDYCLDRRVRFKFLRGHRALRASNLKYASRGSSGKLVTIYPGDDQHLHTVLAELSRRLEGEPGPYILTDLRWGSGPLYLRYGSFVPRHCVDPETGAMVPAMVGPGGELVPDRRTPVFTVPDWVQVPDFLAPHLASRQSGEVDFPYRVESALHFSNGGGVYVARRRSDDRQVVLKEARPYAGLDGDDRDAVTRLRAERDALRRLAGIPGVPALYEHRVAWEHEFLVLEHLPGQPLFTWQATGYPFVSADPTPAQVARYTERAVAVAGQIERLVAAIHARGMIAGDVHSRNLLIDDDDRIALVDFELATPAEEPNRRGLAAPGYAAPEVVTGQAADRYALAALRLWLFLPLIELTVLDPGKVNEYLRFVAERFPLPAGYLDSIRTALPARRPAASALAGPLEVDLAQPDPDWSAVRKSLIEGLLRSATPHRQDRLFPGDVEQLAQDGGAGFGHGAAGVLWALEVTGSGRFPAYDQWLCEAAQRVPWERAGFYDGLYGLAYVLDQLGYSDVADPLLMGAVELTGGLVQLGLHSGVAGAGLTLLHFADRTGDNRYLDLADEVAGRIAAAVDTGSGGPGLRGGLLHGWSGPALFFLRRHDRSGDPAWLDLAVEALHRDLDLCREAPDGSWQVDEGFRICPYLEIGSAGIALVAAELLQRRHDDRLAENLPALLRALRPEYVRQGELMYGRAGMMAALARVSARRPLPAADAVVQRHLRNLAWHTVPFHGRVAFAGRYLRRLSMDLVTGGAGILLAISTVDDGLAGFLPFLEPAVVERR